MHMGSFHFEAWEGDPAQERVKWRHLILSVLRLRVLLESFGWNVNHILLYTISLPVIICFQMLETYVQV
jgi:hypothetical protein